MDLHDGTPFWPRRDGILSTYPKLDVNTTCDVVVVGGGITGSLIGLELSKRGSQVVIVDRRDAGGGSTSASTSMLQYEIDELLIDLTAAIGRTDAETAYRECGRGIDLVEKATQSVGYNCGFRRSPSVFMAKRKRDTATLQRELLARRTAGFDVDWLDREALSSRWGLEAFGAIESACGASVDPYELCLRSLDEVLRRGGRVFDRTEVVEFAFTPGAAVLTTSRGHTIGASHVVVATGYEVERLLPGLPMSLNSSFAVVTEPIPDLDRLFPDGLLFWDHDDPYLYGRTTEDRRILVGGLDVRYRDPVRRRRALPGKTRAIAAAIPKRFPRVGDVDVAFSWCGAFAETPDGLAYIGSHSQFPRCQFALGFGGNGITYSALAAEYISDALVGGGIPDEARIFDVERRIVQPS